MSVRAIRSRRVLTADGLQPACVVIGGGAITSVEGWSSVPSDTELLDVGDAIVMPGLVDTHVHMNEPGRTEWEGIATATAAAAAGGVTTVLDMPLNSSPATTSVAAFEAKRRAATGKCSVNVGFLGGVVPGNADEITPLWRAGVFAFKCFLVPSGVDEFPAASEADLRQALPILASLGAPLMVHAELAPWLTEPSGDPRRYANYLASRPPTAETEAIELVAKLATEYGARVHIVHVSSAHSIEVLRRARSDGALITAETCPHYLTFAADEIPDGATEFKCAPPIRQAYDRDALWRALVDGDLDLVVSDHSPAPPALKHRETGDFFAAWGGIASLQFGLAAVWEGARVRGMRVGPIANMMSAGPARLVGLDRRKGAIAVGFDADLVVWDPDATVEIRPEMVRHRHALTPYTGRTLHGVVRATFVGGRIAYIDGSDAPPEKAGRVLIRESQ